MNEIQAMPSLKVILLKRGLSQRDLAKQSGINETEISRFIHGRVNLDSVQVARIAEALKLNPSEIFGQ